MKKLGTFLLLLGISVDFAAAQLVVDGKNINGERHTEFIQFSLYYESRKMLPVYVIDYGVFVSEDSGKVQKISIDGEEVTQRMTPAYVLNKLYQAGWEYVGDAMFMKAPMMENTQLYTLRRRKAAKG